MSQLSLIFCFFPLLSSSSFFFFLFSRRGWNSRTHKERKRRKWRKRAKLLLSPFLPTIASKYQSVLPSDQLEDTGFLCSAPPKVPTPTSCKEWTNVSGQIRTQKNACQNISSPLNSLSQLSSWLVYFLIQNFALVRKIGHIWCFSSMEECHSLPFSFGSDALFQRLRFHARLHQVIIYDHFSPLVMDF